MPDGPNFQLAPPPRCSHQASSTPMIFCGRRASWAKVGERGLVSAFACDEHRDRGDVPIPASYEFRRVSVTVNALLCAVALDRGIAQAEAVYLLTGGVERAGGLANLVDVHSVIGRYASPPPEAAPIGVRRRG